MSYSIQATSKTPALIIYLIDLSRSMGQTSGGQYKIETVLAALDRVIERMVLRSTRGLAVAPRYRMAMYGYHAEVVDLLGGIKTIDMVTDIPELVLEYGTQTARGFEEVERLLERELPNLQDCPAPLVCHLSDGLYGGQDPQPVAARIMDMSVPDGQVLVENVFISQRVLKEAVIDPKTWDGVTHIDQVGKPYAQRLFAMSSVIPDSYLQMLREDGYNVQPGARMLLPGDTPELVELAFAMSTATPISY